MRTISFDELETADLYLDAIYKGGTFKNVKDDPLGRLLPVGNQGGFRYRINRNTKRPFLCVLYSDFVNPDWPDRIDEELGLFTYFGDNRTPGHELHETSKGGNKLLRSFFADTHSDNRDDVPPLFVFSWAAEGRDVIFKGLAVPGGDGLSNNEDLVAVWKSRDGGRFQNYRAIFTILNVGKVDRAWIADILEGTPKTANAPAAWVEWQETGQYLPLRAERSQQHRKPHEQLPSQASDLAILSTINTYFDDHKDGKYKFEACAAELTRLALSSVTEINLTRPWRDGGRDALGNYRIGRGSGGIAVEFAMEAKCKKPSPRNSCGVKEVSRLISRLRYRQFGVFVTTSCLGEQAYKEIVEDGHPIVLIAGIDICALLKEIEVSSVALVKKWLSTEFP